jgi:uncharacterized membrane protein YvbJ
MSTIGYESWAVDMADVGAMYPFQGAEIPMVIIGVIFWLGWHITQAKRETEHLEEAKKLGDPEKVAKMLERY